MRVLERRVEEEHRARLRLEAEVHRLQQLAGEGESASPRSPGSARQRRQRSRSVENLRSTHSWQHEHDECGSRHIKTFDANLRKTDGRLGVSLGGGTTDLPVFIQEISKGSAADRDGRLRVGDRITHVDGVRVANLSNSDTMAVLKATGDAVRLRVVRDPALLERLIQAPAETLVPTSSRIGRRASLRRSTRR